MASANIANTKVVPVATTLFPYYDDYDEEKNFHRILYRPGYAVQGRELTQMQTILQNQIERFGSHIFKNGSIVVGGGMTLDKKAAYINLATQYTGSDIRAADFLDTSIKYSSGNVTVRAVVTAASEATDTLPPYLAVKWLTGDQFVETDEIVSSNGTYANVASANAKGFGTTVSVNDGIYFINGYFVKVPEQTVIVDRYSKFANARVGLEFTESIITELNDTSLLDQAQESSNYQAPGAARLQINFDLAVRSLESEDDDAFVEFLRVENGVIKKQVSYPTYSVLGDQLARRTEDQSGSWTVRPFNIAIDEHATDNTKFQIVIDPGKAYVKGYEFETIGQEKIDLDKARTTANSINQDITINYGNYLYVQNVRGSFNSSTMELIDIHAVPDAYLNPANTTTYTSTKVGTARVRELKYYSASNTADPNTFSYTISLFDTQFSNIAGNANVITQNTITLYDTTAKFSANANTYAGATLAITGGLGAPAKYKVESYDGATKTILLVNPFTIAPNNRSNISIEMSLAGAQSLIKHKTYTSGATSNANANITVLSGQATRTVTTTDSTFQSLVYPFAADYITPSSIAQPDYSYMVVTTVNFASNTATITLADADERSFIGTTDSTGHSAITLENFKVFRGDNGIRVPIRSVTVNGIAGTAQIVLDSSSGPGDCSVHYGVNLNDGDDVVQRGKNLITGNTSHYVGASANGTFAVGNTSTAVHMIAGQVVISNPNRAPNARLSMYLPDVKQITAIYDLNGAAIPAAGTSTSSYNDVIDLFRFNNGQKDTHYDHAYLSLKSGVGMVKGPLIVCLDWYQHTTVAGDGKGYFSVDSYTNEEYGEIGQYNGLSLRDAIDFRPTRAPATNANPGYTLSGVRIPISGTAFEANYSYYLPYRAHVILTVAEDNAFKIVPGIPALNPSEPRTKKDAMVLYKLFIEPYTAEAANVNIQFVENERFTMRDIGGLKTRIENLEYYQTLTLLEQDTARMKVVDANGLERTKYGILADDFSTHRYGDVYNDDYNISVDRIYGGLYPSQDVESTELYIMNSIDTKSYGKTTVIEYTEVEAIKQNLATKSVKVQPYMVAQYVGNITMNPPADNYVDTTTAPDIIINSSGANDRIAANKLNDDDTTNKLRNDRGSLWAKVED